MLANSSRSRMLNVTWYLEPSPGSIFVSAVLRQKALDFSEYLIRQVIMTTDESGRKPAFSVLCLVEATEYLRERNVSVTRLYTHHSPRVTECQAQRTWSGSWEKYEEETRSLSGLIENPLLLLGWGERKSNHVEGSLSQRDKKVFLCSPTGPSL